MLLPDFRAGLLVEATPIRNVSLAAGFGIETLPFLITNLALNENATAVEVPVRPGLQPAAQQPGQETPPGDGNRRDAHTRDDDLRPPG